MLLYLVSPLPAYAYLDPGTGSYVFQLLIAGLAGSLFLLKVYWKRIMAFFTRNEIDDHEDEGSEEGDV